MRITNNRKGAVEDRKRGRRRSYGKPVFWDAVIELSRNYRIQKNGPTKKSQFIARKKLKIN